MKIRNVAIIAHVDHGKTTLVDQLIQQSETLKNNEKLIERAMDSDAIEIERGITILSKNTSINYKDYKINILDTPGHADFGGEVERIMKMVEGVILLVDAYEGTMPQTKFVLKKALEARVKPIVIINKVDRENSQIKKVIDQVYELFIELGADNEQIDFPILYASALKGTSSFNMQLDSQTETMDPVFETIIKYIPSPKTDLEGPFLFQPALLDYNDYVGRIGIGRISRGKVSVNQTVTCVRLDGTIKSFRIQKLFGYLGVHRIEIEEACAGDICAIAGLGDINVGETLCDPNNIERIEPLRIDEPTLQMTFGSNSSPLAGSEGKHLTARKIEERLMKETQKDVSLKVTKSTETDTWVVSGRGELHLSILIENMRREGFEIEVSKPQVIERLIDGKICEPYEDVQIECPEGNVGSIIQALGNRGGKMINMFNYENSVRLTYVIASRGLIGFMTDFLTLTKGYGIINHTYKDYQPKEDITVGKRKNGALVAFETGKATAYGIGQIESRGVLFIGPGDSIYEGMIVGENNHDEDLAVNVCKSKNMSNMRSASKDNTVVLKKPRQMSLEVCLDYISGDELVEITPLHFRMRKKILNTNERKKYDQRNK